MRKIIMEEDRIQYLSKLLIDPIKKEALLNDFNNWFTQNIIVKEHKVVFLIGNNIYKDFMIKIMELLKKENKEVYLINECFSLIDWKDTIVIESLGLEDVSYKIPLEVQTISLGIPYGLNPKNGINKQVRLSTCIVFGNESLGHFLNDAKDSISKCIIYDYPMNVQDTDIYLLEKEDIKKVLKQRKNNSNKSHYGYVSIIGGCLMYSGAIKLASLASSAMRSGTGVVKIATMKSLCKEISPLILESTLYPLDEENGYLKYNPTQLDTLIHCVQFISFGMGCGRTEEIVKILKHLLLHYKGRLLIDADGLFALSSCEEEWKKAECQIILTPHNKEFSLLCKQKIDTIEQNPYEYVSKFAKEHNCIVLLKGPSTLVTDGKKTYVVDRGCPGMATAGSGDVLSGILAGICPSSEDLLLGVAAGAFINGYSGELAQKKNNAISMVASDTVSMISTAISELMD